MKPKNYKYSICCFFATYPALRSKSNVWLDRNHDTNSMTKWINMSTRGLLLKWASTIKFNYTWWSRYKAVHVLVKVQSGTCVGPGTKLTSSSHQYVTCSLCVGQHSLPHSYIKWFLFLFIFQTIDKIIIITRLKFSQ